MGSRVSKTSRVNPDDEEVSPVLTRVWRRPSSEGRVPAGPGRVYAWEMSAPEKGLSSPFDLDGYETVSGSPVSNPFDSPQVVKTGRVIIARDIWDNIRNMSSTRRVKEMKDLMAMVSLWNETTRSWEVPA